MFAKICPNLRPVQRLHFVGLLEACLADIMENKECLSLFEAPVCAWRTHACEWGHWSKRCDGSKIRTCSTQLTWALRESDVIVDCEWEWLQVYWSQEFFYNYIRSTWYHFLVILEPMVLETDLCKILCSSYNFFVGVIWVSLWQRRISVRVSSTIDVLWHFWDTLLTIVFSDTCD